MGRPRIGIPYPDSRVERVDGNVVVIRTCPVCGEDFPEQPDVMGELTTNNYGEHYAREHDGNRE